MNPKKASCFSRTVLTLAISSAITSCTYDAPESTDPNLGAQATALRLGGLPAVEPPALDRVPAPVPATSCTTPGMNCGLTWVKARHLSPLGQDTVSCHDYTSGPTTPTSCNPYVGDTDCREVRRILCIRQDGSASNGFVGSPTGAPPYYYDAFYNGWAKGNIGLTHGIQGTSLTSLAVANAACVAEFGVGWRMAEHHDGGGGWQWTAYGNLDDVFTVNASGHTLTDRFWVYINDCPGAPVALDGGNCWD